MGPKCKILTTTLCFKMPLSPLFTLSFSTQICHLVAKFSTFCTFLLQDIDFAFFLQSFLSKSVSADFFAFHDVYMDIGEKKHLAGGR